MNRLGTKQVSIKVLPTLEAVFFWKRVEAEIEGHIVGIRTLSDGKKEEHESYQPTLYKTAYLVVTNIRQKPLLVLPEDIVWTH